MNSIDRLPVTTSKDSNEARNRRNLTCVLKK